MANIEEMDDVHIFCNHNMDINDVNSLATRLAETFKINIEYVFYQNGSTIQNLIAGDVSSEYVTPLYDGEKNGTNYILEIGDSALFISNQIIIYNLPTIESYKLLSENYNLLSDSYYKNILEELFLLGANDVYFAEDNDEIRSYKTIEHTFEEYATLIKSNTKYITINKNSLK